MRKMHDLVQEPLCAKVWQTIPNPGKLFGGTGEDVSGLFKLTRTYKNKKYHWTECVSSSHDLQRKSGLEITVLEGILRLKQCAKYYWL